MKSTSALVTGSGEDVVLLILLSDSSNALPHGFPRGKTCRSAGVAPEMCSFSFIYSFLRQYFGPKYDLKLFTSSVLRVPGA